MGSPSTSLPLGPSCLLCGGGTRAVETGFFTCAWCGLLQRDEADFLDLEEERAFYRTHENSVEDPGYRRFLSQVSAPLVERLPRGARGVDYGCGPAPALVAMLREAGFSVEGYDPWCAPNEAVLQERVDFVTCTEVVEHFHEPRAEFPGLFAMLQPQGILALMTELYREQVPVNEWRYARDPTHVVFYRERTLRWIAARHGAELELLAGGRVALFQLKE